MGIGKNNLTKKQILTDPVLFFAFGFGTGLSRYAPGTFGTLAAIPVYCLLTQAGILIYSVVTMLVCILGIRICQKAADKLGEHDYSGIVWDEIAGYLITMWLVPFSWKAVISGFILFRIFDVLKPWPIKRIDREVKGGLGIMLDDVLAGVIAALILKSVKDLF